MRLFLTASILALTPAALGFTLPKSTLPRGRNLYASAVATKAGESKSSQPLNPDHDLLLRVARGEQGHRTPVWLMRQVRCQLNCDSAYPVQSLLLLCRPRYSSLSKSHLLNYYYTIHCSYHHLHHAGWAIHGSFQGIQ